MVSINFEGAKQFYAKQPDKTAAQAAFDTLVNGTGAGNDFIGWVDLPVNYDREEFARIQAAAKKIQSDSKALVVIKGSGDDSLAVPALFVPPPSPRGHRGQTQLYRLSGGHPDRTGGAAAFIEACRRRDARRRESS